MTPEQFKQLLADAMKPFNERMEKLEGHYSTVEAKVDRVIELATPIVGNRRQPGDREPHNGGDSEPRRNIY